VAAKYVAMPLEILVRASRSERAPKFKKAQNKRSRPKHLRINSRRLSRGEREAAEKIVPNKTEKIIALLRRPNGARIAELCKATGWQPHSVRGALAGTLKKKRLKITSLKIEGIRTYRIAT
jgi:hypothetical protein